VGHHLHTTDALHSARTATTRFALAFTIGGQGKYRIWDDFTAFVVRFDQTRERSPFFHLPIPLVMGAYPSESTTTPSFANIIRIVDS
jgi:hypothetical protein